MSTYCNTFKNLILTIVALLFVFATKAQLNCSLPTGSSYPTPASVSCNNTNSNISLTYVNKYKKITTWIPDNNVQIKYINVAFHVFTGIGTIQNTQSTITDINQLTAWVNDFYTNLASPSYSISGVTPLTDTKIRFILDNRIYFYSGTSYYNSTDMNAMQNYITTNYINNGVDPTRLDYLPIYITAGSGQKAISPYPKLITDLTTQYQTPSSLYGNQGVYLSSTGINYVNAQTLAHELGHSLDLMHTYYPSCCHETCDYTDPEYLYDLFGVQPPINSNCWEQGYFGCTITPGTNVCTNNMMGGNNLTNYYLSPMQIGKMHRALSIKSVRKYVKPMSSSINDWVVNQNETWDFDIQMYQNIRVTNGATLTIKCKVAMATNGWIMLDQGANLVITDGATVTSWTGSMWTGIILNGGTSLLVDNGSTIEKAKVAIESRLGAPFTIQNGSKLNANYVGIRVGAYSGVHPGTIKNSTISCYNSLGLPANALIAPYAGMRTSKGIDIQQIVTQVNIGVDQVGQTNNFDNMDMGIYSLLSGLTVYNTNFKNITGTSGNAGRCIASYSNSSVERPLVVGGNANVYQKNSFINSTTGVYASANMDVNIASNIMNNLTTGISINNCGYSGNVINISGNTIDDCSTGIFSIDCKNSTNLFVVGNNINQANPTVNSKPNSKAITITNTSLNTSSSLVPMVFLNNIKRVSTGIEVTNYVSPSIQNNNITALSDLGSGVSSHGIFVTNCPALNLRTNVVKGSGPSSWWMNAIRVEYSVSSIVLYNSVEDIGRGLFFGGWNIGTETAKNNMKNNWDGFLISWGAIGYQNGSSASCKATENKWEGSFLNSHIYSYYSDGSQSTFNLYGSPCNTSSGPCMNPNNITSIVTPTSGSGYSAVPTPVCPSLSGRSFDNNKLNQFLKVAKDEYNFNGYNNNNESVKWWAKYSLFNLMIVDTTLQEDTELRAFADNTRNKNIGKLYNLNESINTGDANSINASINNLNAENIIEQNLKDVYTITIANRLNNGFTNNEINRLQSIAKLCPYESGPAVYNARVLLATVDTSNYKNICEIVPYGKYKDMFEVAEIIDTNNVSVFPNPTNDRLNISVHLKPQQLLTITIYNLAGELMLLDTFNQGVIEVSLANLNEGMYIYKLYINDDSVKMGKLIISR